MGTTLCIVSPNTSSPHYPPPPTHTFLCNRRRFSFFSLNKTSHFSDQDKTENVARLYSAVWEEKRWPRVTSQTSLSVFERFFFFMAGHFLFQFNVFVLLVDEWKFPIGGGSVRVRCASYNGRAIYIKVEWRDKAHGEKLGELPR